MTTHERTQLQRPAFTIGVPLATVLSLKESNNVLFFLPGFRYTFESVFAVNVSTFTSAIWLLSKDLTRHTQILP